VRHSGEAGSVTGATDLPEAVAVRRHDVQRVAEIGRQE